MIDNLIRWETVEASVTYDIGGLLLGGGRRGVQRLFRRFIEAKLSISEQ